MELFEEGRVRPNASVQKPLQQAEIITYVRDGTLSYEDSLGRRGVIGTGEFQRMTAGPDIRYSQMNASPVEWAHVFQVVLRPAAAGLSPGHEQKHFGAAERRGRLRLVVSPDAGHGSLRCHQDARVYSGLFARGQHVVHELSPERSVWLHIVDGQASIGEVVVSTGDGVGILGEHACSFTTRTQTEVLLVELAAQPMRPAALSGCEGRGVPTGTLPAVPRSHA
ncbi:MAG: pirin family protein [Myxococcales bacterium]|nr:pirin family protein [Myxococcales bacterium]